MSLFCEDNSIFLVAAHRGARGVQPENTMTAFQWAMELNVDMIETDIRQTKDHCLVLMHDAKVDRTTDGSGNVRDFTYAEFRRLNAAAHDEGFAPECPPVLEELLEMVASHPTMLLNLELKDYPHIEGEAWAFETADKTIELVEKYGLGKRVILNSFSGKLLKYICGKYAHRYPLHGFYPYYHMGAEAAEAEGYLDVACLFHTQKNPDGTVSSLPGQVCPREWFAYLESRGIEPWVGAGVKTYEDLALAYERGARLVTADNPAQTLEYIRRMGHHA